MRMTMNAEQLEALEAWIEAIIDDKAPRSDLQDAIARSNAKEEVLKQFAPEAP